MSDVPDRSRRFEPDAIIGHYRILARAGFGGMGNVYKAIDTRLNRPVAIKAISDARLRDPKAAGRLRTEALAAASLDHPYICKIYELFDTGDETLIVMEFVEGETLSAILRRGTPPLSQTLQLSAEIAEGLANAHGRGLVHRDVKPSNVMVTPHGHVKLLDFGLAQADVEARPDVHTHTSPSEAGHGGTPQYMAPEQASGGAITARADLFSLGAIVFECLTGKLPFEGTTGYDYVRHLLSDAPRPLYRLAPQAPADLVNLVEQCLEKTPSRRPDSAADVVAELRRISDAIASPTTTLSSIRAARRQHRWRLAITAAIIGLAALLIWRWPARSGRDLTPRQTRVFVSWPSEESGSRISPDARWMSFISTKSGGTQVFVQPIDGTDAKPVTLPAGKVLSQLWSPDGRELGYIRRGDDDVRFEVVPAFFGGTPRFSVVIEQNPTVARLLRWIDRVMYLQIEAGGGKRVLLRIDLDQKSVTNLSDSWSVAGTLRGFDVSPDGKRVAFHQVANGQEDLWVAGITGASPTRLTNDAFFERYPLWSGRGDTIIYQSNRGGSIDLWEIPADGGQTWALTSSQTEEQPESVSADGSLISFQQVSEAATLWTWDTPAQKSRQLTADALSDLSPTDSADGSVVVFQRSQPSPSRGFLMLDSKLFSGSLSASGFSADPQPIADGFAPSLSPNGTRVAYFQRSAGVARTTLFVKELNSDRTVTVSTTCPLPPYFPFPAEWAEHSLAWDQASTTLYFIDQQDVHTIRRVRPGTDQPPPPPLVTAKANEVIRDVHLSASGKLLAYIIKTPTIWVVHLLDLETGADRAMAHFEDGSYLRGWLKNDAGLVVMSIKRTAEDLTALIDLFVVGPEGGVRRAATIDKVFFATLRLAPSRAAVYVTRSENGVHNLFFVPLSTGTLQRVTDNTLTGVTFSGIEPLVGDAVIGVRDERKTDIYLIEKKTARTP